MTMTTYLADSSVWIDFLRRPRARLRDFILNEEIAHSEPVSMEVLSGARDRPEIERVQREIAEIVDRLGITQLNQPAPQVNMADLAAGVFNQPAPSGFVGDRSVQQIDSDIERAQRENAEIADHLGIAGLREGVGSSELRF